MMKMDERERQGHGYVKILLFLTISILSFNVNHAFSNSIPVPDVKAYGSDGPITKTMNDHLSIIVSLDSAGVASAADWWIAVQTPFGWFYLNAYKGSWMPEVSFSYQGPLFNLTPVEILNMSGLPAGTYTFYFGVDMDMNGQLDPADLHYDQLVVNVSAGSPLAGTWVATNGDSYVSLILTEPDRFSITNYTWVNKCTESGGYTASDSSITFSLYSTNCEDGQGLVVGGTTNTSSHGLMDQPSTSYSYSKIGSALSINKIRMGEQTIDLVMDRMDHSKLKRIGKGTISMHRLIDGGNWSREVFGDIPFSIFRLPFGNEAKHNEVYGYGDLAGKFYTLIEATLGKVCEVTYEATGLAEIRGYFYEAPFGGNCMLGVAITDNYFWRDCTITELVGNCEPMKIGDNWGTCMEPDPEWLEFPLSIGHVIHKGIPPYIVKDYGLVNIELGTEVLCPVNAE